MESRLANSEPRIPACQSPSNRGGAAPAECPFTFTSGVSESQGRRWAMEDTHLLVNDLNAVFAQLIFLARRGSYTSTTNTDATSSGRTSTSNNSPALRRALWAVFDGHGGREAAEVLENSFPKALWTEMEAGQCLEAGGDAPGKLEAALERTFYRLDERVLEHSRREGWRAGSTAVVCLLQGQDLLVANVGDSEAVLGELPDADEPSLEATESEGEPEPEPKPEQTDDNKTSGSGDERLCGGREEKQENGEPERARARARARQARREQRQWAHRECRVTARLLTEKHSPTVPEERLRIERAGGRVMLGRVNGSLAVSRAFGDMEFKQSGPRGGTETLVIVRPAIRRVRLDPRHRVLVLACDGLWEKVSYERAVRVAQEERVCGRSAQEAAHALVKLALDEGSLDNITVLVVFFDWNDSPAGSASFQAPAAAASASASGHPAASAPTHMIE